MSLQGSRGPSTDLGTNPLGVTENTSRGWGKTGGPSGVSVWDQVLDQRGQLSLGLPVSDPQGCVGGKWVPGSELPM